MKLSGQSLSFIIIITISRLELKFGLHYSETIVEIVHDIVFQFVDNAEDDIY
jgi:hypothetical protein